MKGGDFEFERLPYSLNAAFASADTLINSAREIALKFADPGGKSQHFVTGDALAVLNFNLESALSACVKSQNALIPYIREAQVGARSMPLSFRDLVADVKRRKRAFDDWLRAAILDYWDQHGKKVRDYRDLAEHYCMIISNIRVVRQADSDNVGLWMILPGNPDAKSPHQLDFENGSVHAIIYIGRELIAICDLADRIVGFLVEKHGGFQSHSVSPDGIFGFRPPMQLGLNVKRPNPLPIPLKGELLTCVVEKARSGRSGTRSSQGPSTL